MKDLNSRSSVDLAAYNNPISNMFEQPKCAKDRNIYPITPASCLF